MLLCTEIAVNPSSAAPGRTIRDLTEPGAATILAWAGNGDDWKWDDPDHVLAGQDRLAVAATRAGLARLLRVTKSTTPTRHPTHGSTRPA